MRDFAAARQDGAVRDALPRGGGRVRRPRRADGARTRRRRRAADRDQGDGRHSARSARRCRTSTVDELETICRRHARRAPRRGGRARLHRLGRRDPRAARRAIPARATSRSAGAGLEEAFVGADRRRGADGVKRRGVHPLRAAADVPQPALHHPLARLSARPLLPHRRAEPARARTSAASGISAPLYFMVGLVAFGAMNAVSRLGRAHRGRARGRLEPPAAADAALDAHVLPDEGADGLRDGAA